MISGKTKVAVHLSYPSCHLRTPGFFNKRCAELGQDMVLVPWEVSPENLPQAFESLRQIENLAGVVVTIPHKESVANLCDSLDSEASAMGVCNVARRSPDGAFHGAMYDGIGFVAGLKAEGHDLEGKSVLLVGAGGAATAVAHALAGASVKSLKISNRTMAKANSLADAVQARFPSVEVQDSDADPSSLDLIVNGTSMGMHAGDSLPVDPMRISAGAIVAEVIMEPDVTMLLKQAEQRGAIPHRGVHMNKLQIDLLIEHLTR